MFDYVIVFMQIIHIALLICLVTAFCLFWDNIKKSGSIERKEKGATKIKREHVVIKRQSTGERVLVHYDVKVKLGEIRKRLAKFVGSGVYDIYISGVIGSDSELDYELTMHVTARDVERFSI